MCSVTGVAVSESWLKVGFLYQPGAYPIRCVSQDDFTLNLHAGRPEPDHIHPPTTLSSLLAAWWGWFHFSNECFVCYDGCFAWVVNWVKGITMLCVFIFLIQTHVIFCYAGLSAQILCASPECVTSLIPSLSITLRQTYETELRPLGSRP